MTDDQQQPDDPITVLVVDDESDVRDAVATILESDPRLAVVAHATNGTQAISAVVTYSPDVVVMDVNMPGIDGCEATEQITRMRPSTRVVALSGQVDRDHVTRMILAGAVGYAVKGSHPELLGQVIVNAHESERFIDSSAVPGLFESVVELAREERRRRAEAEALSATLRRAYRETVGALVAAIHTRDVDTEEHGDRVAGWVVAVGRELELDDARMQDLEYGAIFHDIGKLAIPDEILHNEDDLTEDEWKIIREHTVIGEQILRKIGFLRNVAPIVRHSHEHWDGSGYPDALAGNAIPLESRIVFTCDAYDAMTSERSYQQAMTKERAIDRLHELSGVHFDPDVVSALVDVLIQQREGHGSRTA